MVMVGKWSKEPARASGTIGETEEQVRRRRQKEQRGLMLSLYQYYLNKTNGGGSLAHRPPKDN
jgi:hypothetical protein